MENKTVNWDNVSGKYVKLETDKRKVLVIKDWKLQRVNKFEKDVIEFVATVVEEDNKPVEGKIWSTSSFRCLAKLKKVLETVAPDQEVRLAVTKIGDKSETNYAIEKLN